MTTIKQGFRKLGTANRLAKYLDIYGAPKTLGRDLHTAMGF